MNKGGFWLPCSESMQIKNGPICSQHLIREAGCRRWGGIGGGGGWGGGDVVKVIQITETKGRNLQSPDHWPQTWWSTVPPQCHEGVGPCDLWGPSELSQPGGYSVSVSLKTMKPLHWWKFRQFPESDTIQQRAFPASLQITPCRLCTF